MIGRRHCTPFLGQHVVFQAHGGIHHGILHSVTDDGILVRPVTGGSTRLATGTDGIATDVKLLDTMSPAPEDIVEAWFPFLFFPFLALAWLSPWAWWW